IAAAAAQASTMKVLERQGDVLSGIASASFVSALRELALAAKIDVSKRNVSIALGLADIAELKPSAVAETPLWIGEVIHLCLHIKTGMPRQEDALFKGETFARQSEFRGQTHEHQRVTLRTEFHHLPLEIA